MVFFTSDLHLGHEKIIELTGRPFRDVNEMNRVIIENFNSYRCPRFDPGGSLQYTPILLKM